MKTPFKNRQKNRGHKSKQKVKAIVKKGERNQPPTQAKKHSWMAQPLAFLSFPFPFLFPFPFSFLSLSFPFPFLFPFPFPLRSLSTPFLCLSAPFPSLIPYVSAPNSLANSNSGSVLHGFTNLCSQETEALDVHSRSGAFWREVGTIEHWQACWTLHFLTRTLPNEFPTSVL